MRMLYLSIPLQPPISRGADNAAYDLFPSSPDSPATMQCNNPSSFRASRAVRLCNVCLLSFLAVPKGDCDSSSFIRAISRPLCRSLTHPSTLTTSRDAAEDPVSVLASNLDCVCCFQGSCCGLTSWIPPCHACLSLVSAISHTWLLHDSKQSSFFVYLDP